VYTPVTLMPAPAAGGVPALTLDGSAASSAFRPVAREAPLGGSDGRTLGIQSVMRMVGGRFVESDEEPVTVVQRFAHFWCWSWFDLTVRM
jgi:hypothetical protein